MAENELDQIDYDNLTPAQAARILDEGFEGFEGDTEESETGGEPDASTAEGDQEAGTATGTKEEPGKTPEGETGNPKESELNAENAAIQAKDGKHIISYDKLASAREEAKTAKEQAEQFKQQLEAAQKEMDDLKREAQERAAAGEAPTQTDRNVEKAEALIEAGADPEIFGDFSEEALAKGINTLVQQQVEARLAKALEPMQAKEQQSETEKHFSAIYTAHPDADSIAESQEFDAWIKSQPSYAQKAISNTMENGSATDVIEVFQSYKDATGTTQDDPATQGKTEEQVKAEAKKAVANTEGDKPTSLSEFPGGRPGGEPTGEEAMASMENGVDLLERMENMDPEKIDDYLNRRL